MNMKTDEKRCMSEKIKGISKHKEHGEVSQLYTCPECQNQLEIKASGYFCSSCSMVFPVWNNDGIELVNFNSEINLKGKCSCLVDGYMECDSNIGKMIVEKKAPDIFRSNSRATRYLKDHCGTGNKILDLGCSHGEVGHWIGDTNTVIGLDVCPEAIIQAYNNPKILYKSLVIGNGENLPFPTDSFDILITFEVIEHTVDTRKFVSEISRVLKPGGKLIISCPNLVSIWNRISILFGSGIGISPEYWISDRKRTPFVGWTGVRFPEQNIHIRFFTFSSLTKLLNEYGFQKKELIGSDAIFSNMFLGKKLKRMCAGMLGIFEVNK